MWPCSHSLSAAWLWGCLYGCVHVMVLGDTVISVRSVTPLLAWHTRKSTPPLRNVLSAWLAANRSVWKWHRQGGRDFPSFLSFPIADGLTLARKWSSSSGTINANRSSRAVWGSELENNAAAPNASAREGRGCSTNTNSGSQALALFLALSPHT